MRIIVASAVTALALMACTPTMADTPPGIRGTDHIGVTVPDIGPGDGFLHRRPGLPTRFHGGAVQVRRRLDASSSERR